MATRYDVGGPVQVGFNKKTGLKVYAGLSGVAWLIRTGQLPKNWVPKAGWPFGWKDYVYKGHISIADLAAVANIRKAAGLGKGVYDIPVPKAPKKNGKVEIKPDTKIVAKRKEPEKPKTEREKALEARAAAHLAEVRRGSRLERARRKRDTRSIVQIIQDERAARLAGLSGDRDPLLVVNVEKMTIPYQGTRTPTNSRTRLDTRLIPTGTPYRSRGTVIKR